MKALIQKLRQYHRNSSLEDRWENYKFPIDCKILKRADLKCLETSQNSFSKSILLKELISRRSKGSLTNTNLNFWLIKNWGGIKTFQRNEKNERKILAFENQLKNGRLTKDSFSTISSLSKISSFVDPANYVIYDSRVIYSINWLLLTTQTSGIKFFPMPTGRNKFIRNYDLKTIINLTHMNQCVLGGALFYEEEEAYHEFCSIAKTLSEKVFKKNDKPYLLEMLLFDSFKKEVKTEFLAMTKVKINYR